MESSESLQEAAKPQEKKKGEEMTIFLKSKRGYWGVFSTRKPLRTTRIKGRKDHLCNDEGLLANTPL